MITLLSAGAFRCSGLYAHVNTSYMHHWASFVKGNNNNKSQSKDYNVFRLMKKG